MTDPNTPAPVATIAITDSAGGHVRTSLHSAETAQDLTDRIRLALTICEGVPTNNLRGLVQEGNFTIQSMIADYTAMREKVDNAEAVVRFCVDMAKEGGDAWEEFRIGVVRGAADADEATTPTN